MNKTQHVLGEYLQLLKQNGLCTEHEIRPGMTGRKVAAVSCDSREDLQDAIFFCKGAHFKAEYLKDAIGRGAICYVSEIKYDVPGASYFLVSDVRRAMALFAGFFYNDPWKDLHLIGITGTKGKSSTVYFLKYILDDYLETSGRQKSGFISSIDTYDGTERFESHLTTPEPLELHRHFRNAAEADIEYFEMEVSSQALKYDRVLGVRFEVACFLNIGQDHVSSIEHPDAEDYFQSKLKLFRQSDTACVNLDSDRADEVLSAASACNRVITFSTKNPDADVFASGIRKSGPDILFRARTPRFEREFRLTIPGFFNVENALSAIAVCEALAFPNTISTSA
jgi:UDP-N-acetylmuramoyl-L-alanyl-D-glutamate--2,6-diaminopimelate ligase